MEGQTVSQTCVDFEPEEKWRLKDDENNSSQENSIEDSNDIPSSSPSNIKIDKIKEINGSAFDNKKDDASPKLNGEGEADVTHTKTNSTIKEEGCNKNNNKNNNKNKEKVSNCKDNLKHIENKELDEDEKLKKVDKEESESSTVKSEPSSDTLNENESHNSSPKEKTSELETTEAKGDNPDDDKEAKEKDKENKSGVDKGKFVLNLDNGFPPSFTDMIEMGEYRPAKNNQKELKLADDESLLEAPSFVVPLLIKKANVLAETSNVEKSEEPPLESKDSSYFGKSIGRFLIGLGLSRASECYQRDMTRVKLWQIRKEGKSDELEEEMLRHKNAYNQAKLANEPFKFKTKKCEFCDFQTESILVMDKHYATPHLNFRREYKCNYCTYMSRDQKSIVVHFKAVHGRQCTLDFPTQFYQCPYCTFESHLKTKASSHINKCQKFFTAARNQIPSIDFAFPALTAKPLNIQEIKTFEAATAKASHPQIRNQVVSKRGRKPGSGYFSQNQQGKYASVRNPSMPLYHQLASSTLTNTMDYNSQMVHKSNKPSSLQLPSGLVITKSKPSADQSKGYLRGMQNSSMKQNLASSYSNSLDSHSYSKGKSRGSLFSNLAASGVEITTASSSNSSNKPIITIHPTSTGKSTNPPKLQGPYMSGKLPQSKHNSLQGNAYVICEICDAYIKDLEQLRSHMQSLHKIKIHPKMLANRPPLNCQKCQWRFFTDQGLERHLLGAHGLVTSNMQDMANKNQDGGRCTICGGVFACKLVAHMNRVHKVTLKPAHLSYKCTVCSTTFTLYRLFESHVYTVHSGGGGGGTKRAAEDSTHTPPTKKANLASSAQKETSIDKLKIGNSISITVIKKDSDEASSEAEEIVVTKQCKVCKKEVTDLDSHIIQKHMRKCKVPMCYIEKCEKCLSSFDGMVVLHTSDIGLDDDEEEEEDDVEEIEELDISDDIKEEKMDTEEESSKEKISLTKIEVKDEKSS